jgi:CspA family cold shock protein
MATGTVAWFHETRGFGYIRLDNGTQFVLFHISAIQKAGVQVPLEGRRVQFEIGEYNGHRAAVNCRIWVTQS